MKTWANMKRFYLIAWSLRMVLAIITLVYSAISIFATLGYNNVWVCVFCLSLLNIFDLAEKEI